MSKVPRWGPMTFEDKIENDMFLNRVKDLGAAPALKDFVRHNIETAQKPNPQI